MEPLDTPGAPARSRRLPHLAGLLAGLLLLGGVAAVLVPRLAPPLPREALSLAPAGERTPPVGRPAPDFSLPLMSGGTLSLHSLRGKPVVLNFWASWCAPCREETPLLVHYHKIYGPRGVEFIGVDTEDQEGAARAFIAKYHVDYKVVRAADERLMDDYAIPGLPTTVFIGADGIVRGKVTGGFVWPEGALQLVERLDHLLKSDQR